MLTVIPNPQKLQQQIAALEYQLEQDTSEKDRKIHRAALEQLRKEAAKCSN